MKRSGFTLLEVVLATGILGVLFLGLAAMMGLGAAHTRAVEMEALLLSKAQELADQVRALRYGAENDPSPTTLALKQVFDEDPRTGTATLLALEGGGGDYLFPTSDPDVFPNGFPVPGVFRVRLRRKGGEMLNRALNLDPALVTNLTTLPTDHAVVELTVWFRRRREAGERLLLRTHFTAPKEEN